MRRFAPLRLTAYLAIVLMAGGARSTVGADTLEYPIKATFLLRFGEFVAWPAEAFPNDLAPMTICVIGPNPFGTLLADTIKDQKVRGRDVVAHYIPDLVDPPACQIVYLAEAGPQTISDRLRILKGRPVLTVTDGRTGPDQGIINFVIDNNRVRFAIDQNAAAVNRLSISSKLLNLAINMPSRR